LEAVLTNIALVVENFEVV